MFMHTLLEWYKDETGKSRFLSLVNSLFIPLQNRYKYISIVFHTNRKFSRYIQEFTKNNVVLINT